MSGFSGKAKIVNTNNNLWGWSEIHWSTDDPYDFELNKYVCPKIEPYSFTDEVKGVVGLPDQDHEKTLQQLHSQLGNSDINTDLYSQLKKRSEEFISKRTKDNPAHKAVACKKVTQWIIVEIQPAIGIEWGVLSSFPSVDLWGFLQPFEIGDKKRMAKYDQWVVDDYPRAGWFHTKIRWFPNYDAQGNALPKFTPMMSIHGRNANTDNILEWRVIPCVLCKDESKSKKRHPVRPSYGEGYRFLFKVPVEVENYQTPDDLKRKKEALDELKNSGKLTEKQKERLLRFEVGAYLKVWARNPFWTWSKAATPTDDNTENCMNQMQNDDNAKIYALQKLNAYFNKPVVADALPIPTSTSFGDPTDPNYYVKYYNDFSFTGMLSKFRNSNFNAPDKLEKQSLYLFKQTLKMVPVQGLDPKGGLTGKEQGDATIVDGTIPQKEKERFIPQIFSEDYGKETTYLCGEDTFRPYSFRNHVWKRNRFSEDGNYHEDMWIHVLLWPTEAQYDLFNMSSLFLKEPVRAPLPVYFGVTLLYTAFLDLMAVNITKQKKALKDKLKSLYEWEELPALAATIALYGLPDPKTPNWHGDKPKTLLNMLSKLKDQLGGEESRPGTNSLTVEYFTVSLYKLLQSLIGYFSFKDPAQNTQKLFHDVLSGIQFKEKNGFCKSEWCKSEPKISAVEQKASLEFSLMDIEQKLAAWPLPVPILQWMAFAITLKAAVKGAGEVDFSGMFGESAPGEKEIGVELAPDGSVGVFFDLGAIWTLASSLEGTFTGPKKKDEKGEDLDDHPLSAALKQIFGLIDIQIGSSAKLIVSGKVAWKIFPQKMGNPGACTPDGAPYLKVAIEIPIYWKLSMASGMIAKATFTILTWTSSAVVLFPSGILVETIGGFAGGIKLFGPVKPQRWQLKPGYMRKYESIDTSKPVEAGKKFVFTFRTSEILPKEDRVAGKTIEYFETFFVTPDAAHVKLAKLAGEYQCMKIDGLDQIISGSVHFELSHELLDYGDEDSEKYQKFVKELLSKDQKVDLLCCWNADESAEIYISDHNTFTVKSPLISSFNFCTTQDAAIDTAQSLTFLDKIKIKFSVANMAASIPLYIHLFEIDRGKKNAPDRINRKDGSKGYFKVESTSATEYSCIIPLWELGQITKKDGDNDAFWELCCTISLDSNGLYPIRFVAQGANGDLGYGIENIYSEKYVKVLKVTLPAI